MKRHEAIVKFSNFYGRKENMYNENFNSDRTTQLWRKYLLKYLLLICLVANIACAQTQNGGDAPSLWSSIGPGAGGGAPGIAVHPFNPDIALSQGDTGIIYRTTDGGNSWRPSNYGISATRPPFHIASPPCRLYFHPRNPELVFGCFGGRGLILSEDGGKSWNWNRNNTATASRLKNIWDLAIDPSYSKKIFYYTRNGEFYVSNDGLKGKLLASGLGKPNTINVGSGPNIALDSLSSSKKRTIFLATVEGIKKSIDGGKNWRVAVKGLPHNSISAIAALVKDNKTVLYCTLPSYRAPFKKKQGGLFVSFDLGESWTRTGKGLPIHRRNGFAKFDVHPSGTIYIGNQMFGGNANQGIYRSNNFGKTFQFVTHMGKDNINVETGYFFKPFNSCHVQCLRIAPSNPDVVYAWNGWWGMIKTKNNGKYWENMSTKKLEGDLVYGRGENIAWSLITAVAPDDPDCLFLGLTDEGSFLSKDGGKSLKRFLEPHNMSAYLNVLTGKKLTTEEIREIDKHIGTPPFYKRHPKLDAKRFVFDPANVDIVYIPTGHNAKGLNGVVLKYNRKRDQITLIGSSLTGLPAAAMNDIITFNNDNKETELLVAASEKGVFRTSNGGKKWQASNTGIDLTHSLASKFVKDPLDSNIIYLFYGTHYRAHWDRKSAYGCIYKSTDKGHSWNRFFPEKGIFADVTSMFIYPKDALKMLVAVRQRKNINGKFYPCGVYYTADGGKSWKCVFKNALPVDIDYDQTTETVFLLCGTRSDVSEKGRDFDFKGMGRIIKPGLFASKDGGLTWKNTSCGILDITNLLYNLTVNPRKREIYIGTTGGVFKADIEKLLKK
jgi:photosystem II stability/assembly factor-like uncharacterized protein